MWTCPNCQRIFEKENQSHSCQKVSLEYHFKNKEKAKELFDFLIKIINEKIGNCEIISIPCCIHLFGNYDFLAVFPKKNGLEIRFALDHSIKNPKIIQVVPVSLKTFKNCLEIKSKKEINGEFISWLNESYHLNDK